MQAERRTDEDVDVRLRVRFLEALIALLSQSAHDSGRRLYKWAPLPCRTRLWPLDQASAEMPPENLAR